MRDVNIDSLPRKEQKMVKRCRRFLDIIPIALKVIMLGLWIVTAIAVIPARFEIGSFVLMGTLLVLIILY